MAPPKWSHLLWSCPTGPTTLLITNKELFQKHNWLFTPLLEGLYLLSITFRVTFLVVYKALGCWLYPSGNISQYLLFYSLCSSNTSLFVAKYSMWFLGFVSLLVIFSLPLWPFPTALHINNCMWLIPSYSLKLKWVWFSLGNDSKISSDIDSWFHCSSSTLSTPMSFKHRAIYSFPWFFKNIHVCPPQEKKIYLIWFSVTSFYMWWALNTSLQNELAKKASWAHWTQNSYNDKSLTQF